ncbi:MAG: HK97 family phage prohead protease [Proteobacteria bacterium]|nr:MAG: HK97 family phage prohead protease [Pseudomonadota bacterium]
MDVGEDKVLERKAFTLNEASIDEGGFLNGYGSVFGNVDLAGEVVVKGAFTNLDEFVKEGFLAYEHDLDNQLGTIDFALQDDYGLKFKGDFHSDPESQRIRTRVGERIARGKGVGLSIGYRVLKDEYKNGIRYLHSIKLYEISVVKNPANPLASVTGAKGTRLVDQSTNALTVVGDLVERVKDLADIRVAQNRKPLGQKALDTLTATITNFESLLGDLRSLVDVSEAETNSEDAEAPLGSDSIEATPEPISEDAKVDVASEADVLSVYAITLRQLRDKNLWK